MTEIEVSYERAKEVVSGIMELAAAKKAPFDNLVFPDAIVPEGIAIGSLEHALMLFHACSLDAMRPSDEVYACARRMAADKRFRKLARLEKYEIRDFLNLYFGRVDENTMGNPIETLVRNSRMLEENFQGDPRNLREGDVDSSLKNIRKFLQYGPGKAALVMKNYVRFGMWDYPATEIPIKIDRHVMRISLGAGVVSAGVVKAQRLTKPLTEVYQKATKELGVSAVELDDNFWLLGSKLCVFKDRAYCDLYCRIGCYKRPSSDNRAIVFDGTKETRDVSPGLF